MYIQACISLHMYNVHIGGGHLSKMTTQQERKKSRHLSETKTTQKSEI